jgi:hypothetical protein
MFSYSFLLILSLSFATIVALAGHSQDIHHRSRKHLTHMHLNVTRNITTRGAHAAKAGPMKLVDKYSGQSFFEPLCYLSESTFLKLLIMFFCSNWDFFTDSDPTHGLVEYVSKAEAMSSGLASVGNNSVVVLAVDESSTIPVGSNRKS